MVPTMGVEMGDEYFYDEPRVKVDAKSVLIHDRDRFYEEVEQPAFYRSLYCDKVL